MNAAHEFAERRLEVVQQALKRFSRLRTEADQHVVVLLDLSDPRSAELTKRLAHGVRQAAVQNGDTWIAVVPLGKAKALMPCPLFVADLERPLDPGKVRAYAVSGGHIMLLSVELCGPSAEVVQLGDALVATMPPDSDPWWGITGALPRNRHRLEYALRSAARRIGKLSREPDNDGEDGVALILDPTDDHPQIVDLVKSFPEKPPGSSDLAFVVIPLDSAREMVAVDAPELAEKIRPTPPDQFTLVVRVNRAWFVTEARLPTVPSASGQQTERVMDRDQRDGAPNLNEAEHAGSKYAADCEVTEDSRAVRQFVEQHDDAVLRILDAFPRVKAAASQYVLFLLDRKDATARRLIRDLVGKRGLAAAKGRKGNWLCAMPMSVARPMLAHNNIFLPEEPPRAGEILLFAISGGFRAIAHMNMCRTPRAKVAYEKALMAVMPPELAPRGPDGAFLSAHGAPRYIPLAYVPPRR